MTTVTEDRKRRIAAFIEPLRVKPGRTVDLGRDFDPGFRSDMVLQSHRHDGKAAAKARA
jgi:hypothetical protein